MPLTGNLEVFSDLPGCFHYVLNGFVVYISSIFNH